MAVTETRSGTPGGADGARSEEAEAPTTSRARATASVSNGVIGALPDTDPEAEAGPAAAGVAEAEAEPESAAGVASALRGSSAPEPLTAEREAKPQTAGAPTAGTPTGEASTDEASTVEEPAVSTPPPAAPTTAAPATATAEAGTTAAPATAPSARFSWLRAGRSATAVASGGPGDGNPAAEAVGASGNPNRISRPMVAAAAIGGVVLLAAPFVISATSGDDPKDSKSHNAAAGYDGPSTSPSGYVPSAEQDNGKAPADKKGPASKVPPAPENNAVADSAGKDKRADETSPAGSHDASAKPGSGSKAAGEGTATGSTVKSTVVQQFSAYAGPHCSGSGVSYSEHGSSKVANDDDLWTTATGGYSSNGCNGRFRSVPMSGDGSDAGNYATWSFNTGSVTSGSCRISVHIPDSGDIRHVGGAPSYYTVHAGSSSSGAQLASFTIDQVAHHGQWVAAPNVKISSGRLAVVLHDRGKDWNSQGSTDAHHAADAVYVNCS
ncbi:hypothetical protein ABT115_21835 [Streptomyces sp. NPDC001832]|uniref:hypothetical protein n=1 Tax=Streptomyces sp. NPDC001832 TaxID=3154527 RepID=UPI003318C6F3